MRAMGTITTTLFALRHVSDGRRLMRIDIRDLLSRRGANEVQLTNHYYMTELLLIVPSHASSSKTLCTYLSRERCVVLEYNGEAYPMEIFFAHEPLREYSKASLDRRNISSQYYTEPAESVDVVWQVPLLLLPSTLANYSSPHRSPGRWSTSISTGHLSSMH